MKNYFIIFFILFITNAFFSNQANYEISINLKQGGFLINDQTTSKICDQWIPSLFMPLLFIPKDKDITDGKPEPESYELMIPTFNLNEKFTVEMFKNVPFLENNYRCTLIKPIIFKQDKCYFGLSPRNKYANMKEENAVLNELKTQNLIKEKIFSFDIWNINSNQPNTKFYLGESHEVFNSNKGIGSCENYQNDNLWGCSFKEMLFNNINIPLTNGNDLYKIYFSTETHNLIFPRNFEKILSNNLCSWDTGDYLKCEGFFTNSYYVPLQLTEENEKFVITGQVDNLARFSENKDEQKDYARIQLDDIDYIILPLTVFKEFHIQFDADNNLIKFYTNNPTILKVKETKSEKSFGFIALIIIAIILIILGLGFGAYWLIKMRQKTEKNINQFSKFEDEETYRNL